MVRLTEKIRENLPRVQQVFNFDNINIQVTKDTVSNFIIQIGFAGISFCIMVFLTRMLGSAQYGAYSNAIAWVNIFSVIAPFGFGILLVREISIYRSQFTSEFINGLIRFTNLFTLISSLILIGVLIGIATFVYSLKFKDPMFFSLIIATPLIPLWAFAILRQSTIRGFEKPVHAMLPDSIIRPGLTFIGILILLVFVPGNPKSTTVILITVVASSIALLIAVFWSNGFVQTELDSIRSSFEIKKWMSSAGPLFILNSAQIVIAQSPIVLLGLFSQPISVGVYNVISRLSGILLYLPLAVGTVVSPMIARMHANGEIVRLEKMLRTTTLITFISELFLSIIFLFFGSKILSIFGADFVIGQNALMILILGCLIDGALGNTFLLLIMTGYEKIVAITLLITTLVSLFFSWLVIPLYGFFGVAIVFTLGLSGLRLFFTGAVIKLLNVNISVFSAFHLFVKKYS